MVIRTAELYMRDKSGLSNRIQLFSRRIADWRQRVNALAESPETLLIQMDTVGEELRTAEEEMRQQNEQLLATQELLEEQRQRYYELFHLAPDGYIVTDHRGTVIEANDAAYRLFQFKKGFLEGKPLLKYFHPDDVRTARHQMDLVRQSRVRAEWMGRIAPRQAPASYAMVTLGMGGHRPMNGAAKGEKNGVEDHTQFLWLIRDMGDRQRLEEHVRSAMAELGELRMRMGAELEREGRRRAEAEASIRSKDELLALISHELRNPLTPVLAAVEQLLSQGKRGGAKTREQLEMMRRNLLAERRLIDDLLDVTRIMHGKLTLRRELISLHALLGEIISGIREALAAKELTLYVDFAEGPVAIEADETRMRQVFWNLLNNAIKFTPKGGHIFLKTTLNKVKQKVTVEVRDTGIGIAADSLAGIFNTFEQTKSRFARAQGGLGLGLSIVRSLVAAHDGTIEASSPGVGKGAVFRVHLPLQTSAGSLPDLCPIPPLPLSRPAGKALRICLVDDHVDTLNALSQLLTRFGHHVKVADCVTEAVEVLKKEPVDLLLADLTLPDGSGCDILRKVPKSQVGKAVSLSGYSSAEVEKECERAGFAGHLTKPISIEELQSLLSSLTSA